eukprot:TRINITY_DN13953_c0_g1_i1.p1 TRINITY_DN13953_c0_g1~~TRINITY_DN13953_c0_g1_i1.p1  ORF type:complete len:546 (+),score=111.18 TRINITY_DN13953_c0_g1_i1:46-1638(+)
MDAADLTYSAQVGHTFEVLQILRTGIRVDALDFGGRTALHWAAAGAHFDTVKALLDHGANIDAQDTALLYTPLHLAVQRGAEKLIRLLLKRGASVNGFGAGATTYAADTPLHLASFANNVRVAALLVRRGADVGLRNAHRQRPIDLATSKEMRLVLQDISDRVLFLQAVSEGNVKTVLAELEIDTPGRLKLCDHRGQTGLHKAASRGHTEVIRVLLQAGAPVDSVDYQFNTALHYAAFNGQAKALRQLIQAGASLTGCYETANNKTTPLHCAAQKGQAECVQVLIERGVDVLLQDADGQTAQDVASNKECASLLKKRAEVVYWAGVADEREASVAAAKLEHNRAQSERFAARAKAAKQRERVVSLATREREQRSNSVPDITASDDAQPRTGAIFPAIVKSMVHSSPAPIATLSRQSSQQRLLSRRQTMPASAMLSPGAMPPHTLSPSPLQMSSSPPQQASTDSSPTSTSGSPFHMPHSPSTSQPSSTTASPRGKRDMPALRLPIAPASLLDLNMHNFAVKHVYDGIYPRS